jgi:transcriptional regulator GlxA family with amidase domain
MHEDVPERLSAVVTELFKPANHALLNERGPAQVCMQRTRGGLAPWQVRKLITYIDVNLDRTITTRCLAEVARLSSFHFCRAFRDSFRDSPHGYVIRRRMERAQRLMLTTNSSLGQIAAECGLADQAHFNKLFRKFAGESPGAWRRARVHGALTNPSQPG